MPVFRLIGCATDFSPFSGRALVRAAALARVPEARLERSVSPATGAGVEVGAELVSASPRSGCLALYGAWAVLVAIFVGVILLTGGRAGDAALFGFVLVLVPGAVFVVKRRGERLVAAAASRLGFRVRSISWNEGERLEPLFDREALKRDRNYDLLEGRRDGLDAVVYKATSATRLDSGRHSPDMALGVTWSLPDQEFPRLEVHGSTRLRVLVPARDGSGRECGALSASPSVRVASPTPGFESEFTCFGEGGAGLLVTEAVQRCLLALPRRSRLVVEGSRLRWETEVGLFAGGLGRRAEELLDATAPLRDALLELPRTPPRRSGAEERG